MSSTQVRADEATTNHEENNYGLFSLSADTGATSGSSLLLYVMAGIAVLGMYLQYKSWKASRTTKRIRRGGKEKPSVLQRLCDRGESSSTTLPTATPAPAPIVVRPPPCPCTTRTPDATQEVLSGLLPVIRQQVMQLQSQIMRVLTDVQDVTSNASIRMPVTSTPRKQPLNANTVGRTPYTSQAYSGPVYTTPLSRSLPNTQDKATFCGYPSDEEEDQV